MSEVGPDSVLYQYRLPDQVLIVGAEAQERAYVSLAAVELLAVEERAALRTAGPPLWLGPEPVRDELRVLRTRVVAADDRDAVERAIDLVEYACTTGTGVAIVPPAESA